MVKLGPDNKMPTKADCQTATCEAASANNISRLTAQVAGGTFQNDYTVGFSSPSADLISPSID